MILFNYKIRWKSRNFDIKCNKFYLDVLQLIKLIPTMYKNIKTIKIIQCKIIYKINTLNYTRLIKNNWNENLLFNNYYLLGT